MDTSGGEGVAVRLTAAKGDDVANDGTRHRVYLSDCTCAPRDPHPALEAPWRQRGGIAIICGRQERRQSCDSRYGFSVEGMRGLLTQAARECAVFSSGEARMIWTAARATH